MRVITLTKNKYALVDDEDFGRVSQYKWQYIMTNQGKEYAVRSTKQELACITCGNHKPTTVYLHRFVLDAGERIQVDHKDRNGLNNQKGNLRACSASQQSQYKKKPSHNTSGFKGVSLNKNSGKYHSSITINKIRKHLGVYKNPVDAAMAYDREAVKNFGEFAVINFPD